MNSKKYLSLLCLCIGFLVPAVEGATCFYLPEYFPLVSGNAWTFREVNSGTYGTVTVLPGTTLVSGVATKALYTSPGALTSYETNDASRWKLYRRTTTFEGVPIVITFSPRVALGVANACVGNTASTTGVATVFAAGYGTYNVNYTSQSFVEAQATVSVPAGTYETFRLRWVTHVYRLDRRRVH